MPVAQLDESQSFGGSDNLQADLAAVGGTTASHHWHSHCRSLAPPSFFSVKYNAKHIMHFAVCYILCQASQSHRMQNTQCTSPGSFPIVKYHNMCITAAQWHCTKTQDICKSDQIISVQFLSHASAYHQMIEKEIEWYASDKTDFYSLPAVCHHPIHCHCHCATIPLPLSRCSTFSTVCHYLPHCHYCTAAVPPLSRCSSRHANT